MSGSTTKYSMLICLLAATAFLLLAWIAPLSKDFLVRALLIGTFTGLLMSRLPVVRLSWADLVSLAVVAVVLLAGGFYWSRDHAFGNLYPQKAQTILVAQYVSGLIAAAFMFPGLGKRRFYNRQTPDLSEPS